MALKRFKTAALREHKGNFDKIIIIPKPGLDDILWWTYRQALLLTSEKIPLLQSTQVLIRLDGELVLKMDGLGVNLVWKKGDFRLIS